MWWKARSPTKLGANFPGPLYYGDEEKALLLVGLATLGANAVAAERRALLQDFQLRYVGIPMDPKYSDQDVADIIAAVRKVYPRVMVA